MRTDRIIVAACGLTASSVLNLVIGQVVSLELYAGAGYVVLSAMLCFPGCYALQYVLLLPFLRESEGGGPSPDEPKPSALHTRQRLPGSHVIPTCSDCGSTRVVRAAVVCTAPFVLAINASCVRSWFPTTLCVRARALPVSCCEILLRRALPHCKIQPRLYVACRPVSV